MSSNNTASYTSEKTVGCDLVLDLARYLGKGDFGAVYQGKYLKDNEWIQVAVKMISTEIAFRYEEDIIREINSLSQVNDENVAKFYNVKRTAKNIYIINQFCKGGSLFDRLLKSKQLEILEALSIIKQVAKAFKYMSHIVNEEGKIVCIMHRDLKPQNIMFHEGIIKIIDFGFARAIESINSMKLLSYSMKGTRYYASYQILCEEPYSSKTDVWSAGIILYEMIVGSKPWVMESWCDEIDLRDRIKKDPLKIPEFVPEEVQNLIKGMLEINEDKRFNWEDIINHHALKQNLEII